MPPCQVYSKLAPGITAARDYRPACLACGGAAIGGHTNHCNRLVPAIENLLQPGPAGRIFISHTFTTFERGLRIIGSVSPANAMPDSPERPVPPAPEHVHFVADARLLSILGEQLIGSERVGILELVKNSYDAGARNCDVTIEGVPTLEPSKRTLSDYQQLKGPIVEITDDGSGMTRDDIVNGWLRPATSSRGRIKDRLKREREKALERGSLNSYDALVSTLRREHGGRLPLGEKGVGRLATHRLGQHLWLRTKTKDDPLEWELKIDWNIFESPDGAPIDLSAVPLTLQHQAPTAPYRDPNHGTVLVCHGGRRGYEWTEDALLDLARALGAIQSPRAVSPFSVTLRTPHVDPARVETPFRYPAPFQLVAIVEEDGIADIELTFEPPEHLDFAPTPFKARDYVDLRSKNIRNWRDGTGKRKPSCGPFLIHANCWIRIQKWLGPDFREITEYLDHFGGLAIYRDGVLAQPAQQSARSDWLGLASAQIKKSSKLSYYQLLGEIEIDQSQTLALRDKSNREGFIETEAFRDLTELTKAILNHLEFYTRRVRDQWTRSQKIRDVPARSVANAARASARLLKTLSQSYDFSKDPLRLTTVDRALRSADRAAAMATVLEAVVPSIERREEERSGLVEAAGFGLAVAVGVHGMARVASRISSDCRSLARNPEGNEVPDRLRNVSSRADALLAEIQRVTPLRTARTEASQSNSVKMAVEMARAVFASAMDDSRASLRIHGDDFRTWARFGALSQVFANLVDNALYWLSTVDADERTIKVILNAEARRVLFADSGPGVSEKMLPLLFEPFYSEKSPPSGLGLYICRYYLGQMKATIRLARTTERCELGGAQFLLDFGNSPEVPR